MQPDPACNSIVALCQALHFPKSITIRIWFRPLWPRPCLTKRLARWPRREVQRPGLCKAGSFFMLARSLGRWLLFSVGGHCRLQAGSPSIYMRGNATYYTTLDSAASCQWKETLEWWSWRGRSRSIRHWSHLIAVKTLSRFPQLHLGRSRIKYWLYVYIFFHRWMPLTALRIMPFFRALCIILYSSRPWWKDLLYKNNS